MLLLGVILILAITAAVSDAQEDWVAKHCNQYEGEGGYQPYRYNKFHDIICFTFELATTKCPPAFTCTVESVGHTFEGRDIYLMHVTSNKGNKAMWIDALIHSDEWLAGATTTNLMEKMLSGYRSGGEARRLLDNFDWYFMPVVNPDGYEWAFKSGHTWRKNRNINKGSPCRGVDINRNFDINWGDLADVDPCEDMYLGSAVLSEPEARTMQNTLLRISKDLVGLWTMHAHGSRIVYPYGNCTTPPWKADYDRNIKAVCDAATNTYGQYWRCGNNCEVTGIGKTGAEQDWAVAYAGIKYVLVTGMRTHEFIPDKKEIVPSTEEMWNGLIAFLDDIVTHEKL